MARRKTDLADQEARQQIATDLDRTLLVEAAAGTGKTTCLIDRMIGLLREGKCRIETLAAVTFTRKAAAELRTRFQLALEKQARETRGQRQERLLGALNHVERCFIGTIHSFCARLLRERPVEAGLDPGFNEIDEDVDYQLRRKSWREYVATLIATDDAILKELARLGLKISPSTRRSSTVANDLEELGLEPAELGPAFLRYAEFPDVADWPAEPVKLPNLKPCIAALTAYYRHVKSLSLPSDPGNDKLMPKLELLKRMIPRADLDKPAELMEVLEQFAPLEKREVIQRNWPGQKQQAVDELDRWNTFVTNHAGPLLTKWREHRYEPVMRAIRPARDLYDRLRREQNGLNFQDLLLRSVSLLRDKPEVRRYFSKRFSHLLIDEFQDTDPIQAEVMLLLTADDPNEADWQKCRPVPGSLFVVGDPKQSIYRFRRADIVTYSKVRSIVEKAGGAVISLAANFRSGRPIVKWVNECFEKVFPTAADTYSPADRPLVPGREHGSDAKKSLERLIVPASLRRNDEVADFEADQIARTIRRAVDEKWPVTRSEEEVRRGVPEYARPGDFLIVARSKARLSRYGQALQRYRLPHLVSGGRVLNDVAEVDLLALCLSSVVRSDDPIALVAVLRSPLFGVSDRSLFDFRRLGGRFTYYSEIPQGMVEDEAAALRDAFDTMRTYSSYLHRMPPVAAIERIAGDLGLIARAAASEEGNVHAGSLLKAIELLRSVESPASLGDFVNALANLADGAELHDGAVARPFCEPPVRVMNLHQCKGLEAPFVFLVDPTGESDHDVSVHIDRTTGVPRGYLPIYGPRRTQWGRPPILAHPPGWDTLAAEEQKFLDAEMNRLLYVAATRAGTKLVVSQRDSANAEERNPWRVLAASMQGAGAFADPGNVVSDSPIELKFEPESWSDEISTIANRWQSIVRPTYAVEAMKEAAIRGRVKPHGAEKHGAEWGEVLHTLLETAMNKPEADLRGLALSALGVVELPVTLVDEVMETVQKVIDSDIWRRAQKSPIRLTEVPIATLAEASGDPDELPTVLRGVIDLVFREEAGWVVVDYKSERVDAGELPALVEYYKPQIVAYADVWLQALKESVIERGILFTHTCQYISLPDRERPRV